MENCLCIAFKFNDIFYTINTSEFRECKSRHLLIFYTKYLDYELFPFKELFNSVRVIPYSPSNMGIFMAFIKLFYLRFKNIDLVFLGNIKLIINQFLINRYNNVNIVLLEDGTMNYQLEDNKSQSWLKKLLSLVFQIDLCAIKENISRTYLLEPNLAKYWFGQKKKLELKSFICKKNDFIQLLKGKKILIGGNYYHYGYMSLEFYNKTVNEIIKEFGIDYYVPHQGCDPNEKIHCNLLNLTKYGVTFEMLLPSLSNTIFFSLGSSILFSANVLNSKVKPVLVKLVGGSYLKSISDFYEKTVKIKTIEFSVE